MAGMPPYGMLHQFNNSPSPVHFQPYQKPITNCISRRQVIRVKPHLLTIAGAQRGQDVDGSSGLTTPSNKARQPTLHLPTSIPVSLHNPQNLCDSAFSFLPRF